MTVLTLEGVPAQPSSVSDRGTVHLVYPHGPSISAPDAIGRHLGRRLEGSYQVKYHDWTDRTVIDPQPWDVLLGHPHPSPATVFRRSMRRPGWHRVLMLAPFNGDLAQVGFEDAVLPYVDQFLAITGPFWFQELPRSLCSHWAPKMVRVDLAVDTDEYPRIKSAFNAIGHRRLVYIGHSGWMKNTAYLSEIAKRLPGVDFAWMGSGERPIAGLASLGRQDFASREARARVADYDFMITVGSSDANPTTVLEAMAWGLIPICTAESGYAGIPGVPNVPLGNADRAATIVEGLLQAPEAELRRKQEENWALLESHYSWDRLAEQVIAAIESGDSPPLGHEALLRRLRFRWEALRSPHSRVTRAVAKAKRTMAGRLGPY